MTLHVAIVRSDGSKLLHTYASFHQYDMEEMLRHKPTKNLQRDLSATVKFGIKVQLSKV